MKHLLFFSGLILLATLSCSKEDTDARDAASIEGRWKVESIRYTGTLVDGTKVSGESDHCDFFMIGDVMEFKEGKLYLGEKGSGFYSSFSSYPGSIQYSIVNHRLFIPEQVFSDAPQDAGEGWSLSFTVTIDECFMPYSLTEDTWVIRYEHRGWFDIVHHSFDCDFEFVLKRVE